MAMLGILALAGSPAVRTAEAVVSVQRRRPTRPAIKKALQTRPGYAFQHRCEARIGQRLAEAEW